MSRRQEGTYGFKHGNSMRRGRQDYSRLVSKTHTVSSTIGWDHLGHYRYGEVVVPSTNGTTDFSVLQNELKGKSTKIVMVARMACQASVASSHAFEASTIARSGPTGSGSRSAPKTPSPAISPNSMPWSPSLCRSSTRSGGTLKAPATGDGR
jgi:hypothetical protein